MQKVATTKQAALVKARLRRIAFDRDRDARDRRIEQGVATVFVLLDQREEAARAAVATNANLGEALRVLVVEGIGADGAAELVGLEVAEVRRLLRSATPRSENHAIVAPVPVEP